jgi:hypothetical protein
MKKPPVLVTRTMLCVGVLGSAAAVILRPEPVVFGVFGACLLIAAISSLRHAGQKVDRIVAEELDSPPAGQAEQASGRGRRHAA